MEIVVRVDGAVKDVLVRLVEMGYFKTRSEAIRAGLLELGKDYGVLRTPEEMEDILAIEKMKRLEKEEGEFLSLAQVKRKYPAALSK
jgi:Arc/MetJ-type ribon-helix-helix transcriptional regulator